MKIVLLITLLTSCSLREPDDESMHRLNHTRMLYAKCRSDLYLCKNKRSIEVEEEIGDE